jgi:hypothetical protein
MCKLYVLLLFLMCFVLDTILLYSLIDLLYAVLLLVLLCKLASNIVNSTEQILYI